MSICYGQRLKSGSTADHPTTFKWNCSILATARPYEKHYPAVGNVYFMVLQWIILNTG